jgi:hypothetical protein
MLTDSPATFRGGDAVEVAVQPLRTTYHRENETMHPVRLHKGCFNETAGGIIIGYAMVR